MATALQQVRGLPLMRAFGVWVVARPSTILLLALFALFWGDRGAGFSGEALLDGVLRGLTLLVSVLFHELAHGAAVRMTGGTVRSIELSFMGGRTISSGARETPGREFFVAAAGPGATLLLSGLCFAAVVVGVPDSVEPIVVWSAWMNLVLAVLNLLPGLPLDGGVMAAAVVWAITRDRTRGTIVAAWAGRTFAILMVIAMLGFAFSQGRPPQAIEYALVGLLFVALWMGATRALAQVRASQRVRVASAAEIMHRVVNIDHRAPLSEADQAAIHAHAEYVIVRSSDGRLAGYYPVVPEAASSDERGSDVTAGDMIQPLLPGAEVQASDPAPDVVDALRRTIGKGDAVVVRDRDAVAGLIVAKDFAEFE